MTGPGQRANALTLPLHEHDAVTIVVGSPPVNFSADQSFKFPTGE